MALLTLNNMYNRVAWPDGMASVSQSEYTSTKFLEDAHIIAQDINSEIVYYRENTRNWETWYADTVALQSEYTNPAVTSEDVWAERIDSVAITYESDTYTQTGLKKYTVCRQATIEEQRNWEYLLENQPKNAPIYFQADKSIFIAPDPRTSEVWTSRIKITWARSISSRDWTTSTTETDIKFPLHFWEVITLWCVWKANARARKDRAIIIDSKNEYTQEKRTAIKKMNLEVSSEIDSDNQIIDPFIQD